MKPISCSQEMGDTERLLCPGAHGVLPGITSFWGPLLLGCWTCAWKIKGRAWVRAARPQPTHAESWAAAASSPGSLCSGVRLLLQVGLLFLVGGGQLGAGAWDPRREWVHRGWLGPGLDWTLGRAGPQGQHGGRLG